MSQRCSRPPEPSQTCPLTSSSSFAIPDKRCGILVPTCHGLFQPVHDLQGALRILSAERTTDDDALHRLGHVEPGAPNGRVERHHPMVKQPAYQIIREMT